MLHVAMEHIVVRSIETPIGQLAVEVSERGVRGIQFSHLQENAGTSSLLDTCLEQLAAYFNGERTSFTNLSLVMEGTSFQASVWTAALAIPFGETRTYRELAETIGQPGAARAVGNALNRNPLPILVPCHRVIPASGGIGKYGGGAWRKAWLLEHEKMHR